MVRDVCYRAHLCKRSVDDRGSVDGRGEEIVKREVLRSLRVLACAGPFLTGTAATVAAQEPEPSEVKSTYFPESGTAGLLVTWRH